MSLPKILIGCVFVMGYHLSWMVSGFSVASLDNQLMNLYLKSQEPSQQQLFATREIENIYDSAREAIIGQETYNIIVPLQQTYDHLVQTYPSCDSVLKRSDIVSILVQDRIFVSEMASLLKTQNLGFPTATETATSCKKIIQCTQNSSSSPASLTTTQSKICLDMVSSAYSNAQRNYQQSLLLSPPVIDDTMFVNGTLEDSPYDLLVDIGQISRLLYESPTNPPVVTFFAMPTLPGDGGGVSLITGAGSPFVRVSTGAEDNDGPSGPGGGLFSGMAYSGSGLTGSAYNNLTGFINRTTGRSQSGTYRNNITTLNRSKPSFIEDPLLCEVGSPDDTNNTTPPLASYPTQLNQQLGKSDTNGRINQVLGLGGLSFGSGKDGGIDDNGGSTPETIDLIVDQGFDPYANPDNAQTQQCLARCDRYGLSDKLLCQARCLCGQITSPGIGKIGGTEEYLIDPGAFMIKYCQIPATPKAVIANKPVMSIQDIINELRNVVKNLRESGQLLKHTQPKEHLDTSMSKINMGQLFAFDLAIAFKPVFDQPEPRQQQETLKDEIKRTVQQIKQQQSDTAIRAERNKYLIVADPCRVETLGSLTDQTTQALNEQQSQEESCRQQSTTLTTSQLDTLQRSADMNQSLATSTALDGFVASQARFWREMRQLLGQVSSIASTLRTNIAKGN